MPSTIPPWRAALLVLLVAVGTYANSVLNGFAYDDNTIIVGSPVVTEGRVVDALTSSYWPQAVGGAGLYRPVTLSSFALEWGLWNGHPAGFHLVNLAVHSAVSLLVFLLLLPVSATLPALVGGVLFAVHPVHSEAVANVVGRSELYSALFVLGACLLFLKGRGSDEYSYTNNVTSLGFVSSDGVIVAITGVTDGWSVNATHSALGALQGCAIYYGGGSAPATPVVPSQPGEMACTP